MSALVHCIYTSVQTSALSAAEIDQLVQDSRVKNTSHAITGILLHVRDTFFQVLEGPSDAVDALWTRILVDPRHTRITRIIYEPIPHRFFADSAMTLATFSPAELAAVIEENDSESRELLLSGIDEGRAKRLLRAFSEGRWRARFGTPVSTAVRA